MSVYSSAKSWLDFLIEPDSEKDFIALATKKAEEWSQANNGKGAFYPKEISKEQSEALRDRILVCIEDLIKSDFNLVKHNALCCFLFYIVGVNQCLDYYDALKLIGPFDDYVAKVFAIKTSAENHVPESFGSSIHWLLIFYELNVGKHHKIVDIICNASSIFTLALMNVTKPFSKSDRTDLVYVKKKIIFLSANMKFFVAPYLSGPSLIVTAPVIKNLVQSHRKAILKNVEDMITLAPSTHLVYCIPAMSLFAELCTDVDECYKMLQLMGRVWIVHRSEQDSMKEFVHVCGVFRGAYMKKNDEKLFWALVDKLCLKLHDVDVCSSTTVAELMVIRIGVIHRTFVLRTTSALMLNLCVKLLKNEADENFAHLVLDTMKLLEDSCLRMEEKGDDSAWVFIESEIENVMHELSFITLFMYLHEAYLFCMRSFLFSDMAKKAMEAYVLIRQGIVKGTHKENQIWIARSNKFSAYVAKVEREKEKQEEEERKINNAVKSYNKNK